MSEATQATLGSMIVDNDCIAEIADKLTLDMFPEIEDRQIWTAILALHDEGSAVDLLTLRDKIGKGVIDIPYVIKVCESMPSSASVGHYSDIVVEDYRSDEVTRLGEDVTRISQSEETASDKLVLVDKAFRSRTEFDKAEDDHIGDIAGKVVFGKDGSSRIPVGLNAIDNIIIGAEPTDYIVVAGRPGMGKTSLMVDICTSMSGIRGIPVSLYSCEMSPQQIVKRMCSALSGVPLFRVESANGFPLSDDIENLNKAAKQISSCPMYIKATGGITPSRLKRMIANDKRKYGIQMAFVDHLHLMRADKPTGNGYQDLTSISRTTKQIVLETGVPIIMGCQLSRTEEAKEPRLMDIRGTGAIEEDADIVIAIHRPSYWTNEPDTEAWFHVLKGRHFGTGVGEAEFHGNVTSFCDKTY